jgi:hypothetical protein
VDRAADDEALVQGNVHLGGVPWDILERLLQAGVCLNYSLLNLYFHRAIQITNVTL